VGAVEGREVGRHGRSVSCGLARSFGQLTRAGQSSSGAAYVRSRASAVLSAVLSRGAGGCRRSRMDGSARSTASCRVQSAERRGERQVKSELE